MTNEKHMEDGAGPSRSRAAISTDQFATLMAKISRSNVQVATQLTEFKDEVRLGQEEAASKVLKRARHDKPYQYKRKGNEEQATFNTRVDEALAEAQLDLPGAETSPALGRVHKAVDKGKRLIAERQKLIRIADRSELGWNVVVEYTTDELAEDSEDEKRLEKAEHTAEKAAKRRKKWVDPPAAKQGAYFAPAMPVPMASPASYQIPVRQTTTPPSQLFKLPGPCFACSEMGHVQSRCPKTPGGPVLEQKKWYPSPELPRQRLHVYVFIGTASFLALFSVHLHAYANNNGTVYRLFTHVRK